MDDKKGNSNIVGSEILIYQTEDGHIKIDVKFEDLKMRLFGLRRHNYVNSIKPVNLISVSILNTFSKRELEENSVVRKFRTTASDGKKL